MDNWDTDKEFLATFRAEAEERLQCLDDGLMMLEQNPADQDLIKRLFREAHTLKGSAGMMGFTSIRDLSHRIEDIFSAVQKGQVTISRAGIDVLLAGLDRIRLLLPVTDGAAPPEIDNGEIMDQMSLILSGEDPGPISSIPAPESVVPRAAPELPVRPVQPVTDIPPSEEKIIDPTIRVNIDRLDQLLNLMGEVMVYQNDNEHAVAGFGDLRDQTKEMQSLIAELAQQVDELNTNHSEDAIAGLSQRLADAGGTANELRVNIEDATTGLAQNCASRKLVLDELQDRALSVRMLPVGTIFKTFPRLVRDVSAAAGKKTKLVITGEDCELDKRILEQIADPLMHILRNAVHHGIEDPDERVAAGKPAEGIIHLSAAQKGDRVEISVEDDGGGIDPVRVGERAIAKGMIPGDAQISAEDAHDLIFNPGLSTADVISDISGRGVGLDVVKHNIELLEGAVDVSSQPGEGTKFTVLLPVTLAVITALMVESNQDRFAIPLGYIQEMVALDEGDIQSLGGQRGFLMRGIAVPLIDMHEFIGGQPTNKIGKKVSIVIVGNDRFRLGLMVGRLLSEQEIVIKSTEGFLPRLQFVAGVCIMGSGDAAIVVNVSELLTRAREGVRSFLKVEAATPTKIDDRKRALLLVVEDSLVVRELQKNILESAGYDVETAVDGQDALTHLAKKSFDCVITDVEMPRMNGIDLTTAMRHHEETKDTPVVIVTSMSSEQDRRHGLDAGANAYMMKGAYDQKQLLATIERLVA